MFNFLRNPEFRLLETREKYLEGNIVKTYQIEYKPGFFNKYRAYKFLYKKEIDKRSIFRKEENPDITLVDSSFIDTYLIGGSNIYNTTVQHSGDELEIVKFIMKILQIIHSHKSIIDNYSFQTFSPIIMFISNDSLNVSNHSGEIYLVNLLDRESYNNIKCYRCFCLSNIKNKKIVMNYLNKNLVTSIKTEKYYL